jgi:hypothetical protein
MKSELPPYGQHVMVELLDGTRCIAQRRRMPAGGYCWGSPWLNYNFKRHWVVSWVPLPAEVSYAAEHN